MHGVRDIHGSLIEEEAKVIAKAFKRSRSTLVTRETPKRAFKRLNGTQLNTVRYGK